MTGDLLTFSSGSVMKLIFMRLSGSQEMEFNIHFITLVTLTLVTSNTNQSPVNDIHPFLYNLTGEPANGAMMVNTVFYVTILDF